MRTRLPPLLLAVLIAAPLFGFLPRIFGARAPDPLDRRPTWSQLVVVTCDRLPTELDREGPGIATLERRAARAAVRAPGSGDRGSGDRGSGGRASAATTLWTGRPVSSHGVTRAGQALPAGAWTVAEAGRRTGAASAAFLETAFVSGAGIAGFERLVEQAGQGPERLATLADEHLAAHPGERSVLWLHLDDPGPSGARLDVLLEGLLGSLDNHGHRWDALVVATALTAEAGGEVPLWAALPSALYADRQGRGAADLADLAGVLLQLLRLPAPDVTRGEVPIESTPALGTLLRGGSIE